ncbi:polysaccharide export protein [Catenovulum agarivorans DS-2]|uniref:Polysaccharide export protein n=1 Tax=Catenovulum agarivorans DS-2 TaxID=1328313 RepID=W7QHU9_9ALTE|nr:SLBB domain-containing protein [Catenovulum agarivorans]EWH08502.1 polysaccharide export protein [Catenovulum agarivorans DS-2]
MKQFMLARIVAIAALTLVQPAQAAAPSQEQIAQFKQLPKAQQQALAAQYGINLNEINQSVNSEKVTNPKVVTARSVDDAVVTEVDKGLASSTGIKSDGDAKQQGKKARVLKPFGYELFAGSPSTFAPATDVPVPSEYVIGPGDTIKVQLFGKEYKNYELSVDRNGAITMPETGPLQVVGMSFTEFKNFINQQIEQKVIGAKANVTMGDLRSIRIFVLGEAYKPGAYTVSSLSSITHALFVSGGITEVGSLRNIQLKRKGKVVTTFDLYDLLLKGDTSNDTNLLPGDVVFIPPVGPTVGIDGEVKRPAIYELNGQSKVEDVINLAGGLLTTAYPKASKIERLRNDGTRTVLDIDLSKAQNGKTKLKEGDVLRVYSVLDEMENIVRLEGHVHRPGSFAYKAGMKVLDIVPSITDLRANPDLEYGIIVREEPHIRTLSAMQFSLKQAFLNPESAANITLQPRDRVYVFSADGGRQLNWLLDRLKAQARLDEPAKTVSIAGHVRYSGEYPLTENMQVKDLIKAAFDLKLETDLDYALLKRKNFAQNITDFKVLRLNQVEDLAEQLQPQDKLYVFSINGERESMFADLIGEIKSQTNKQNQQKLVTIAGQVRFPGTYPLAENMVMADLVAAAGGFTESSYMVTANLSRFKTNLTDSSEFELISVDLDQNTLNNYQLAPRDTVSIQRIPEWRDHETVTLMGEFKFPGTYAINKGETLAELIKRAGGFSDKAFLDATIFTRTYLKQKEQALLNEAEKKLRRELIASQINAGEMSNADSVLGLLSQLEATEASGRMIIDKAQLTNVEASVKLRGGDTLIVPQINQAVSIIGEVYAPTAQIYNKSMSVGDYIDAAGGFNQLAESSDVYVIKANGRVVSNTGWFSNAMNIEPGDTIVVPTNVDPVPALTIWKEVTSIIYQSTVAIAAVAAL